MKKFSLKIKAHKYISLLNAGLTSEEIAIFLDEMKKLGDAEKKLIQDKP